MRHLFSFTIVNTSSLLLLSIKLILSNLLHNHISKAFSLSISAISIVHVSQPYSTTDHISTFQSFFQCLTQSFCQKLFTLIECLLSQHNPIFHISEASSVF